MTPAALLITNLRTSRNLSQKKASSILGYKQTYLCAIERGRVPTNRSFLDKLIAEYGLEDHEITLLERAVMKSQGEYKIPIKASPEKYELVHSIFSNLCELNNKKINLINAILDL